MLCSIIIKIRHCFTSGIFTLFSFCIKKSLNIELKDLKKIQKADLNIIAVPHNEILNSKYINCSKLTNKNGLIFDIKGSLSSSNKITNNKLFKYMTLWFYEKKKSCM